MNKTLLTIDQYERVRIHNWFPWLAETVTDLDKELNKRLTLDVYDFELSMSDLMCTLRWYNRIPDGFNSSEDTKLAQKISSQLSSLLLL
jgi:hypothetical protein